MDAPTGAAPGAALPARGVRPAARGRRRLPRVLAWDCDGVVLDTESADARAWIEAFAAAGVVLTPERYAAFWAEWGARRRTPMIERLRRAAPHLDEGELAVLAGRRAERYRQLCAQVPARAGIRSWLIQARLLGITNVLATNNVRAREHLSRLGLAHAFAAVVTTAGGLRPKPSPDVYRAALRTVGADPAEAVAIEDSPHGAAAARAAGLAVLALPTPVSAHLDLRADAVLPHPAAHHLREALAALPRARTARG